MDTKQNRTSLWVLTILILANYLIWQTVAYYSDSQLHIYFLNVGQGDAILIRTPDHKNILVDGGPDDTVVQELGKVLPIWDRNIDLMVLTHPQADHVTGLFAVLKRFKVKEILATFVDYPTKTNAEWKRITMSGDYIITWANASTDYYFNDMLWDTLYPIELPTGDEVEDVNETSIVAQITYKDHRILLTGDAGFDVEQELIEYYPNIQSDILKIGHHGSRYASSEEFLSVVQPEIAVIQVGENSYGHPAQDTLDRLEAIGADIYRTDIDDTIEVILGREYQVKVYGQKEFHQE